MRSYIAGLGFHVPEKILTNKDFEKIIDTTDEWIRTHSGIVERHAVDEKTASSDLAIIACKKALSMAEVSAQDIGAIVCASVTPDMAFPSTACLIQTALGAPKVFSFDISAGCSGFVYGLAIGDSLVKSGHNNVLVIGADCLTKITDYTDRGSCFLFGDGAGAVLLKPTEEDRGILSHFMAADGASWKLLYQVGGGSRKPASHETVDNKEHCIRMEGNAVFKVATRAMTEAAVETLKRANVAPEQVKLVIPHQANIRIIDAVAKRLNAQDKIYVNIDKYGNTSSASIPIALAEAFQAGRIQRGDLVLLIAFGAGFTWGGVLVKW
jgi:3-oxoacyl-[acyl-carrier-protein] synthase-3